MDVRFKHPPVVETVLSVQFQPVAGIRSAHLGAYWRQLGEEWRQVSEESAIDPQYERFGDEFVWGAPGFQFRMSSGKSHRIQAFNRAKDRMIQLQNGRFIYNWLATSESEYPSYESVRPEFDREWNRFCAFLVENSDAEEAIVENQWEVVYVNHIRRGKLWSDPKDWPGIIECLQVPPVDHDQLSLEQIGGEWRFEINPQRGRLFVRIGHVRIEDEMHLVLNLTARGPIDQTSDNDLNSGLDLGHHVITSAFRDLTSDAAHNEWELENATDN